LFYFWTVFFWSAIVELDSAFTCAMIGLTVSVVFFTVYDTDMLAADIKLDVWFVTLEALINYVVLAYFVVLVCLVILVYIEALVCLVVLDNVVALIWDNATLFSCFGIMLSPSDYWTKSDESLCVKKARGFAILVGFCSTLTADLAIGYWGFISYFYSLTVLACCLALAIIFSPLTRRYSIASPLFLPWDGYCISLLTAATGTAAYLISCYLDLSILFWSAYCWGCCSFLTWWVYCYCCLILLLSTSSRDLATPFYCLTLFWSCWYLPIKFYILYLTTLISF